MFLYEIKQEGSHVLVIFEGDLDIDCTETVEDELIPALTNYKSVTIEFEKVEFVDSSGMGLLLNLVQSLKDEGITVRIRQVREEVMEVFDLLQIPEILGRKIFVR
ncbi:STAS domain-containing protein [Jeotgalibacillus haloalkalitolerans]|uniref:Anti-sigma factor antagonist n=1 Tax=Jeotgalibacillus haloalkalitolerans TaxID=3104292 RepID=A0ABU5KJL8_9BACL|nr:STAS domain-containing protein [Jeotgalibacillus sp. HH7-29]MDZ5711462.1 STAS domain-containing protein [Jeotgalibacillus sp. HH7-29]